MIGSICDAMSGSGFDSTFDSGIDSMSDSGGAEKMLYQLVTARLDGGRVGSAGYFQWASALVEKGIGGFIVFGGGLEEVWGFVDALQGAARVPLFIMSDVERGVGWQLAGATPLPCQMALCAALSLDNHLDGDDSALLDAALSALAVECIHAGINMPLVPVLDVNSNPLNPIVCTRAFSDRPEVVARFGVRYVRALNAAGLLSCVKHFPGHGDTRTDSHIGLPVIARSRGALRSVDLPPFTAAIAAGAPAVMVAHIAVPALDDTLVNDAPVNDALVNDALVNDTLVNDALVNDTLVDDALMVDTLVEGKILPATLSQKITTGLLRRELGFGGLIVTDALNMGALKDFRHAPAACLKAGADVLLHPQDADECVAGLAAAMEEKFLDRADVERAYKNILKAKEKFSSLNPNSRNNPVRRDGVDFTAHAALSLDLHRRSITMVKGASLNGAPEKGAFINDELINGASAPFNPARALLVLCGDYAPDKPRREIDLSPLKDAFGVVVTLRDYSPPLDKKPVVFAVFTSVAAWRGTSGLDDAEAARLRSAISITTAGTCVISFGSPYVLAAFGGADILIAAYEPAAGAQRAVVECLRGERPPCGRLPVRI
jgi:beta-glucosidase-like glycosyl hydrolase